MHYQPYYSQGERPRHQLHGVGRVNRSRSMSYHGAPHTVSVIAENIRKGQADPLVRQVAERITARLANKDVTSEALAIYYWVLAHTRYTRDPANAEFVRTPRVILEAILGRETPGIDCDDMTVLIGALCASIGAAVRAITVAFNSMVYRGERQYSHVFPAVQEPTTGAWLVLDPVAGDKTAQMLGRVTHAKIWPMT